VAVLGLPVAAHAAAHPALPHLVWSTALAIAWAATATVLDTLSGELQAAGVPGCMRAAGGRTVLAALLYWALMGFFNLGAFS
jgi:hypothetical protein